MALRHLEAVRDTVSFTLTKGALGRMAENEDGLAAWIKEAGINPTYYHRVPEGTSLLSLSKSIRDGISIYGLDMERLAMAGTHSRYDEPDLGFERSSSGWDKLPNFITSSAFIRVLGAMEQYELDVLKALFYYRPAGKQSVHANFVEAAIEIIAEIPDQDGQYKAPALWSWIRRSAENTIERRRIFKTVFGIECFPEQFGEMKSKEIKSYYQDLYESRNALAHGRSLVEVSLGDYCKAEAFALSLVTHLSKTCFEKYQLGI